MARFETVYVGRKIGKVPEYLKDEIGKKPKSKITITPGPVVANKMEEAKQQTEVFVKPKEKIKIIEEDLGEGNDLDEIEVMKPVEVEEIQEPNKEEPKEITKVNQLKYMFKDELMQLAKSLNIDENGTKTLLIERIAKKLNLKE